MTQYFSPPDLNEILKDMKTRIKALANSQAIPIYTLATRPATTTGGVRIIFVQDATAGQRFQGWDSTAVAWVPLG